jgi:hypothetical protein
MDDSHLNDVFLTDELRLTDQFETEIYRARINGKCSGREATGERKRTRKYMFAIH